MLELAKMVGLWAVGDGGRAGRQRRRGVQLGARALRPRRAVATNCGYELHHGMRGTRTARRAPCSASCVTKSSASFRRYHYAIDNSKTSTLVALTTMAVDYGCTRVVCSRTTSCTLECMLHLQHSSTTCHCQPHLSHRRPPAGRRYRCAGSHPTSRSTPSRP